MKPSERLVEIVRAAARRSADPELKEAALSLCEAYVVAVGAMERIEIALGCVEVELVPGTGPGEIERR
jgi:deoxycytidylate deaminase